LGTKKKKKKKFFFFGGKQLRSAIFNENHLRQKAHPIWDHIKFRAKEYVYALWTKYEEWDDLSEMKKKKPFQRLIDVGKQHSGFLGQWMLDAKILNKGDVLDILKQFNVKHEEKAKGKLEEPLTRWSDLSDLESVDPYIVGYDWSMKEKMSKMEPKDSAMEKVPGKEDKKIEQVGKSDSEDNIEKKEPEKVEGDDASKEQGKSSLLQADNNGDLGMQNLKESLKGARSSASDKARELHKNLQKFVMNKGWPPKFTHSEAMLKLGKYAWHGLNRVYKYRLVHMKAEEEWTQFLRDALDWLRGGIQEKYAETKKEIRLNPKLKAHFEKQQKKDKSLGKKTQHQTEMLLKMGILGDIERETEGEPFWITEVCDRRLAAFLVYNELYSNSNTGDFAYMDNKQIEKVTKKLSEKDKKDGCKIEMSLIRVDDSLPDAMDWYNTLPEFSKPDGHDENYEKLRKEGVAAGNIASKNYAYRRSCSSLTTTDFLLPVSWNRSLEWLRVVSQKSEDSLNEFEKRKRQIVQNRLVKSINQHHNDARENFARGLYFRNRMSISKIIDKYWSHVDPRDENFEKKLTQKAGKDTPYKWLRESLWKCIDCWGTLTLQLRVYNAEAKIQKVGFIGPITRFTKEHEDGNPDPDKDATDSGPKPTAVISSKAMLLQLTAKNDRKTELEQIKVRYSFDYIIGYWVINRLCDRIALTEVLLPLKSDIFLPYRQVQQIILDMAAPGNKDWDSSMNYRDDNKFIEDFNNQMKIQHFENTVDDWRRTWFRAFRTDTFLRATENDIKGARQKFSFISDDPGKISGNHSKLYRSQVKQSGHYIEWYIESRIVGKSVLDQDNFLEVHEKATFPLFGKHMPSFEFHLFKIAMWQKLHKFYKGLNKLQEKHRNLMYSWFSFRDEVGFSSRMNMFDPFPAVQEIDLFMDEPLPDLLNDIKSTNDQFRNQLNMHLQNVKGKSEGTAIPSFLSNSKNIMQKTDVDALEEIQKKIRHKLEEERDNEILQTREKEKRLRDGFPLKEILEEEQQQNIKLEKFFSILHITSERENSYYHTAQLFLPIYREQIKSYPKLRKQMILVQTALGEDRSKTVKECLGADNDTTILGIRVNCQKFMKEVRHMLDEEFKDKTKVKESFKLTGPILMVQKFLQTPRYGTMIITERTLQLSLFMNLNMDTQQEINFYVSDEDKIESEFLHAMNPRRSPTKTFFRDGKIIKHPQLCIKEHSIGSKLGLEAEKINIEVECNQNAKQKQTDQEIFDALVEETKRLVDIKKKERMKAGLMEDINQKIRLSKKETEELKAKLIEFEIEERKRRQSSVTIFIDKDDNLTDEEDTEERKQEKELRQEFKKDEEKKKVDEWNNKLGLNDEKDSDLKENFKDLLGGIAKSDFKKLFPTTKSISDGMEQKDEEAANSYNGPIDDTTEKEPTKDEKASIDSESFDEPAKDEPAKDEK